MVFAAHGFAAPVEVFPVAPVHHPVVEVFVEDVAAGCPGCLVAAADYSPADPVVVDCLFVVADVVAFALVEHFVVCLALAVVVLFVVGACYPVAGCVPCLFFYGCFFPGCSGLSGPQYLHTPVLLL